MAPVRSDEADWLQSEPVRNYVSGGNFTHKSIPIVDHIVATITFANGQVASVAQGDSGATPYVSKFSSREASLEGVFLSRRHKGTERILTESDNEMMGGPASVAAIDIQESAVKFFRLNSDI